MRPTFCNCFSNYTCAMWNIGSYSQFARGGYPWTPLHLCSSKYLCECFVPKAKTVATPLQICCIYFEAQLVNLSINLIKHYSYKWYETCSSKMTTNSLCQWYCSFLLCKNVEEIHLILNEELQELVCWFNQLWWHFLLQSPQKCSLYFDKDD